MKRTDTCKAPYCAPEVRLAPVRQERAFLQSIQTGPIGGWTEDPDPDIEF